MISLRARMSITPYAPCSSFERLLSVEQPATAGHASTRKNLAQHYARPMPTIAGSSNDFIQEIQVVKFIAAGAFGAVHKV